MPPERDSDRGQDTSKHLVIGGLLPRKRFRMPAGIPRPARLTTAVRRRQENKETDSGNVVARPVPKKTTEEDEKDTPPEPQGRKEAAGRSAVGKACRKQSEIPAQAINHPAPPKRRSAFRIGKTTARTRRTAPPEPKDREPARRCRPETSERSTKGPDKRSERKSGEKSVPESIVPEPKNRYRSEERTAPSGVREKRTDAPGRVSAPSAPYTPAGTLTRRSARARYSSNSCWPD